MYKNGDKVVLIKNVANFQDIEVGKIYEVDHSVYGDSGTSGYRIVERNEYGYPKNSWFVYPEEIAAANLVTNIDSEIINEEKVTYKVGDIVRIVREVNGGNLGIGHVGKITTIEGKFINNLIDNEYWYSDNEIEHASIVEEINEVSEGIVDSTLEPIPSHIKIGGMLIEEKTFTHDRYNEIVEDVISQIKELSEKKGGEYAGDVDRLANFRRNAKNLDLNMEDIWSVYAAKHWDAIGQYVKDLRTGKKRERLESISGRAHDLIVYLILFLAMVEERDN